MGCFCLQARQFLTSSSLSFERNWSLCQGLVTRTLVWESRGLVPAPTPLLPGGAVPDQTGFSEPGSPSVENGNSVQSIIQDDLCGNMCWGIIFHSNSLNNRYQTLSLPMAVLGSMGMGKTQTVSSLPSASHILIWEEDEHGWSRQGMRKYKELDLVLGCKLVF